MNIDRIGRGNVRKLWVTELALFRDHLLRLDPNSRRMRFGMVVNDGFIEDYARGLNNRKSLVYAYIEEGEVRAAAELRRFCPNLCGEGEAACSVEAAYQDSGIGTDLLGRVIRAARNRNIHRIHMNCLRENRKMQRVARKHDAVLHFEEGDVIGEVAPATPDCISIWREAVEDEMGFVMAALDIPRLLLPAA